MEIDYHYCVRGGNYIVRLGLGMLETYGCNGTDMPG